MLCKSHSGSGAVAGLAVGVALHKSLGYDAALAGFTAGMALLPDTDSCGSMPARSLGFLSGAVSHVVRFVSGGHRHATHSILGIAVFTGLAILACHFRHDYIGMAGLALLITLTVSGAAEALHLAGSHMADVIGIAVAAGVVFWGYGLALIPLAVALGCIVHCVGDSCTDSGVMWLFPCKYRFHFLPEPLAFTTGSRPELFVDLFLAGAFLVLTAWAIDPSAVTSGWHHAVAFAR
jgi:membrane-bound metal-dependent hydrolase YbcI (DUF457 family)